MEQDIHYFYHVFHLNLLLDNGDIYSTGLGLQGALGLKDDFSTKLVPTKIVCDIKFSMISAGVFHSMAVSKEGFLYHFGNNRYKQGGNDSIVTNSTPTLVIPLQNQKILQVIACNQKSILLTSNFQIFNEKMKGKS